MPASPTSHSPPLGHLTVIVDEQQKKRNLTWQERSQQERRATEFLYKAIIVMPGY